MIIIIEGIDRVGKTTLVNKLTKECDIKPFIDSYLNFTYFSYTGNESNSPVCIEGKRNNIVANTEKINSLLNFFEQFSDNIGNVLLDRFHLSEFVYGLCDRNYLSLEAFRIFDNRLAKMNALIIYVEPKDLDWSSKQHGSNLINHLNTFEDIIEETNCEVIRCNFDTLNEAVFKVKERIANDTCT